MTKWKTIVVLAALAGCASTGAHSVRSADSASGHWDGSLERDGWWRPFFVDIERDNGAWRGKWRAVVGGPSMTLKQLEVQGNEVRFEADNLGFVGHLTGDNLSGTIVDLRTGAAAGEFSVTRDDPVRFAG